MKTRQKQMSSKDLSSSEDFGHSHKQNERSFLKINNDQEQYKKKAKKGSNKKGLKCKRGITKHSKRRTRGDFKWKEKQLKIVWQEF